ncbi:MAG: DNA cytosine methyltransferase, partial [Gemmatimonadota bacterium]|nr:DNA cytosine methyltransferase [Gemmatimonadota bacterium]
MNRPPLLRVDLDEIVVDSFAGGGGASEGIRLALGRGPHIAINHDAEAIALHAANHPETTHYQENVWRVDPVRATGGRPVGLMWLSPDCKHFSKAKGGKPVSKKIRGLAWVAVRWAKAVSPRVFVLENVEEFQTWGPVLADGKPCPARKGRTFRAFIGKLRRLGYDVDWRQLRACDYGAPTIRRRLFIIARRDGRPIVWPKPTHGKGLLPWRTAAECIDWSVPCPSIFERSRPLAENTLRRIARGIQRFVIDTPTPFIVNMAHGGKQEDLGAPLSTIATEKGGCRAIIAPSIIAMQHDNRPISPDEPLQTITTQGNKFNLVAPVVVPTAHAGDARAHSVEEPLRTITGGRRGDHALVAPTLVQIGYGERDGQAPRAPGLDKPLGTVVASGAKHALVEAFIVKHYGDQFGGRKASGADEPLPTITGRGTQVQLATAHMLKLHGSAKDGRSMELPAPTIRAGGTHLAEVRAFLVAYYGNEKDGGSLFDPMRTVTSKDRLGLVAVHGVEYAIADIGMRMLIPRELYRAQGFGEHYAIDIEFNGKPLTKTAQVRMC